LKVADLTSADMPDYQEDTAIIEVAKNGKPLGTVEPSRRFYKVAQQATAEVALRTGLNEDLYINFATRTGTRRLCRLTYFRSLHGSGSAW